LPAFVPPLAGGVYNVLLRPPSRIIFFRTNPPGGLFRPPFSFHSTGPSPLPFSSLPLVRPLFLCTSPFLAGRCPLGKRSLFLPFSRVHGGSLFRNPPVVQFVSFCDLKRQSKSSASAVRWKLLFYAFLVTGTARVVPSPFNNPGWILSGPSFFASPGTCAPRFSKFPFLSEGVLSLFRSQSLLPSLVSGNRSALRKGFLFLEFSHFLKFPSPARLRFSSTDFSPQGPGNLLRSLCPFLTHSFSNS